MAPFGYMRGANFLYSSASEILDIPVEMSLS